VVVDAAVDDVVLDARVDAYVLVLRAKVLLE